jgi:DNA-binding FadR family transcriptional regulator
MTSIPKLSAIRRDASASIRLYVKDAGLQLGDQLPAERELAIILGIARGRLRNALGRMKARGEIWQHVGKGTFVGESPLDPENASLRTGRILDRTNPLEIVDARLLLEPRLAALAAVRGNQVDFAAMTQWVRRGQAEKDYPSSHRAGDAWHRAVAIATHSELLLWMFDHLFMIRGAIHWGRLPPDFHDEDVQTI